MATATRTIDLADCSDFAVMPRDQGQIVEYAYALLPDGCGSGEIVRRITDQSDGTVSYAVADLDDEAEGDAAEWQPWNGRLPAHGVFEDCADAGIRVRG